MQDPTPGQTTFPAPVVENPVPSCLRTLLVPMPSPPVEVERVTCVLPREICVPVPVPSSALSKISLFAPTSLLSKTSWYVPLPSSFALILNPDSLQHSTGRGGIGNMTGGSRSRSRARDSTSNLTSGTHTPLHSTGRGGAGNILSGHTPSVAEADEIDVIARLPRHSDDMYVFSFLSLSSLTHEETDTQREEEAQRI